MKRFLTGFIGKNHCFKKWLRNQRPANVVSLAEYRQRRRRKSKPVFPAA